MFTLKNERFNFFFLSFRYGARIILKFNARGYIIIIIPEWQSVYKLVLDSRDKILFTNIINKINRSLGDIRVYYCIIEQMANGSILKLIKINIKNNNNHSLLIMKYTKCMGKNRFQNRHVLENNNTVIY